MDLSLPVRKAGFLFQVKAAPLERLNIWTVSDLLFHVPFRYEDFTKVLKICDLEIGVQSTIKGKVVEAKNEYTRRKYVLQKVKISDGAGEVTAMWFNQIYIPKSMPEGTEVGLVGKLGINGRERIFHVKEYEILDKTHGIHTNGFVPVYSETKGVSSKWMRNRIYDILRKSQDTLTEFIPKETVQKLKYPDFYTALRSVHFPKSLEDAQKARERLSFDELLLSHLSSLKRRDEWNKKTKGIRFNITGNTEKINELIASLPFTLTKGQQEAVDDILKDLSKEIPMNRLVEGDVGSGKTVVAAVAMYCAYLNGYQSAFMAPTEILALQHYETIRKLLEPLEVPIELITGSKKLKHKDSVKVTVGTHALLEKGVDFAQLGLVIIDEQQRFGVKQRAILRQKTTNPHFLTMTATPIPRTVLLALYNDLDVSLLPELPKGRQTIKTWLVPKKKRDDAYSWIKTKITDSKFVEQAFIVCPFIEESESMDTVKAAKVEFERLQKEDLKGLKLGLLHGKLKAKEKTEILKDFADKKIHVLVATPVVEVGIDIPDATIMVIEAADRFGLAQLHQLRGRVGRGKLASFCLLFTESTTEQTVTRLRYMEQAHSGFELAELDLKLRGGGDIFGTRQHGVAGLKIADFSQREVVESAKKEAEKLFKDLQKHPELESKVNQVAQDFIQPD